MRPFRIRKSARHWFRQLRDDDSFKVDFDAFYFCVMAGLAMRRKVSVQLEDTAELVDYFPDRYRPRGRLLVALFLSTELEVLGVAMDERRDVHSTITKLVSPSAANFLSIEGVREFNRYAHGGYEQLEEWFQFPPQSLETFLRGYKLRIDSVMTGGMPK